MLRIATLCFALLLGQASAASADGYAPVTDPSQFMKIVQGKTLVLTRPGIAGPIALQVRRDGQLAGEARGYDLTGFWRWEGDRFCREMDWGGWTVQYSCQAVSMNGSTLRFIADRGMFRTAYFEVR